MLSVAELRLYRSVFVAATLYNVLWGAFVVLFPTTPFAWAGMPLPNYPAIWQCIGMFVLVYAIGYAYLAVDPVRYAPFALVALAGKILGPIGWLWAYWTGQIPGITGLTILTNDLVWWPFMIPFVWKTIIAPAAPSGIRPRAQMP